MFEKKIVILIIFYGKMMVFYDSQEQIDSFLTDASNIKGKTNNVYIPENINEFTEIIAEKTASNIPILIRGSGTSTTGASVPTNDTLISTQKLNNIIDFDKKNKIITIEPGLKLNELNDFCKINDLFFPPNPTEIEATIGGNIATNASGARSFLYGTTANYVKGIDVIIHNTDKVQSISIDCNSIPTYSPNRLKNASGYTYFKKNSPYLSFIGSEGTIGAISKIKLQLIKPANNIIGLFIFFDSYSKTFEFVSSIRKMTFDPTNLITARLIEFYDKNSLSIINKNLSGIPNSSKTGIWIEQEVSRNEDEIIEKWFEIIEKYSNLADDTIFAQDETYHRKLSELRHSIPLYVNEKISRNNIRKVGTDTAVPHEKFQEYFDNMYRLLEESRLEYLIFGHIGNSHLHTNIIPNNINELKHSIEVYDKIMHYAISIGGTISAEHGIGKIKNEYFKKMNFQLYNEYKKIKAFYDPKNLFGRGNIF